MRDISKIELRQLRQFCVVAEELHFRRAALRLGMAQPPLSQAIAKLEAEIGASLFDRSRRQITLTEAGVAFRAEAQRLLAQLEEAVDAARSAEQGHSGRVRATFVGAAAYGLLPQIVRAHRAAYPKVEIALQERTTVQQIASLQSGEADIGFVRPPIFGADDIRCETLLREPFVVALPEEHRLASRGKLRLAELAGEGFVMFPAHEGPSFHARIVRACDEAGFAMRVVQEAVQMHMIVSLVAAGLGVALVPASLRNLGRIGVTYRDLDPPASSLDAEFAMIWRRGEPSSAITAFLETARAVARVLPLRPPRAR
ncbi:LysR family transcriptional regulator [Plastoroseomonas hellenica]|uniref:LysR family transcriptional regulator n=1 Tax=Plastoroseomonas hellenica TaxID=2687306 RepID=UPI001BAAA51A|nr:LysR family transcriptional regulator [Plastoroseomonas hellenica]